jgi:hypothetical protein
MLSSGSEARASMSPILNEFLEKTQVSLATAATLQAIERLEPGKALVYHVGYLYSERTPLEDGIRCAVSELLRDRPDEFESVQRRINPKLPVLSIDGRRRAIGRGFVYILRYKDRAPQRPQARRLT